MTDKIIIHNYSNLLDLEVLNRITTIVSNGLLSQTKRNGKQYCFYTTFKDGYAVSCDKNENTYTFKVVKE